jgi:hypothetical protein
LPAATPAPSSKPARERTPTASRHSSSPWRPWCASGRNSKPFSSAIPLPKELLQQLETALARVTDKKVLLETEVDARVLGGVSAQVGSVLYDGTLRTGLDEMHRALKR